MNARQKTVSSSLESVSISQRKKPLHLVWVSSIKPAETLDAATWLETTKHLRCLGWQVDLVAVGPRSLQSVRGVDVVCLPRPAIYVIGQIAYHLAVILFLLRRWQHVDLVLFDQISCIWLIPMCWWRSLTGQARPFFVMDTRDLADFATKSWRVRLRLWFFNNIVFGLARRWADGQTAITERMADLVGIPTAQRLGYWPSGVDVARFAACRSQRTWPLQHETIELIYIGSFVEKRNLLPLSHAICKANEMGMKFRLSLYGDGKARVALAAFAQQSKGTVRVMQPVAHDEVPLLLAQAHVGVTSLPSPNDIKYQASSPVKLFEYLAAGMPMLSTRNVCHTEVIGSGTCVIWADSPDENALYDALCQLWQQRDWLAAMGTEAAEIAPQWSWSAAAGKLSNALVACIEGKK